MRGSDCGLPREFKATSPLLGRDALHRRSPSASQSANCLVCEEISKVVFLFSNLRPREAELPQALHFFLPWKQFLKWPNKKGVLLRELKNTINVSSGWKWGNLPPWCVMSSRLDQSARTDREVVSTGSQLDSLDPIPTDSSCNTPILAQSYSVINAAAVTPPFRLPGCHHQAAAGNHHGRWNSIKLRNLAKLTALKKQKQNDN